jgi:AcrR family transcriptional regulator
MPFMTEGSRARPGRPRLVPDAGDLSGREQILDAAAELFVRHGFAATSTRMIAERVGIRQASLYYHFAGKDELLLELLTTSVRPSLEVVHAIERCAPDASPAAALYALALVDAHTLAVTPHNVGTLYLLPEIQYERYDAFRQDRLDLQLAYGRMGYAAATPEIRELGVDRIGALLLQLAEVVIQVRHTREPDQLDAETVAASCLRLCGLSTQQIGDAAAAAVAVLDACDDAAGGALTAISGEPSTTPDR